MDNTNRKGKEGGEGGRETREIWKGIALSRDGAGTRLDSRADMERETLEEKTRDTSLPVFLTEAGSLVHPSMHTAVVADDLASGIVFGRHLVPSVIDHFHIRPLLMWR